MRTGLCAVAVIVSLLVAVACLHGYTEIERAYPTPAPTQTPAVEVVERLVWIEITQTPRPYRRRTPTPEVEYRWPTPTPYGPTRGIVKVK